MLTKNLACRFALRTASAVLLIAQCWLLSAGEVRLEQGELRLGGQKVAIRGVDYSPLPTGAAPGSPFSPCLYARDFPLLAAMGANTVRTYTLLPEGDTTFLQLLRTTGLYWLAGFPLDAWYDPSRSLTSRQEEILAAFRAYATRFRGERRLMAYVIGDDVSENYSSRFAGSAADYHDLLAAAVVVLSEIEPADTPLIAASTRNVSRLADAPAGLAFWLWTAGPREALAGALADVTRLSSRPVLVEGYSPDGIGGEGSHKPRRLPR